MSCVEVKLIACVIAVPPNVFITHQRVGAQVGSNVSLECLTAAYPPSLNMWARNENQFISEK